MVSFGTTAKGFYLFLSNCLSQILIINKVSPFKVAVDNAHMVYSWNMYTIDGTNIVRYFSKKGERFIFTHDPYLEQLLILNSNNNDKSKHHKILKNYIVP